MAGHEAVAQKRKLIERAVLSKQVEVNQPVGIRIQNESAGIAALCNMMWHINSNHPRQTGHGKRKYQKNRETSRLSQVKTP